MLDDFCPEVGPPCASAGRGPCAPSPTGLDHPTEEHAVTIKQRFDPFTRQLRPTDGHIEEAIIRDGSLGLTGVGWIPRKDGWRLTSVIGHVGFIPKRSARTNALPGSGDSCACRCSCRRDFLDAEQATPLGRDSVEPPDPPRCPGRTRPPRGVRAWN